MRCAWLNDKLRFGKCPARFRLPPTANQHLIPILGSKTDAWSGKRNTKWLRWTSSRTTCRRMVTPTPNSTSTLHSSRICPHRTRGTVFRILARDSTSFINLNNIKDTRTIRTVPRMLCSVAIVVTLKSIRKSSDLKTKPPADVMIWWPQLMGWVELNHHVLFSSVLSDTFWYRWLRKFGTSYGFRCATGEALARDSDEL